MSFIGECDKLTTNKTGEDVPGLEFLIECVRDRKTIFDVTDPDYKDATKKEILWNEISLELNQDVKWCKDKWRYLRDNYKKKKHQLKGKSGMAAKKITKWEYFEPMSFIDKYTDDAETTGNIVVDNEGNPGESKESDATPSSSFNLNKRKKTNNSADEVDKALVNYLSQRTQKEEDTFYYYGLALAQRLRCLPPAAAAFARIRLEQVMYEIEYPSFEQNLPADHNGENRS